MPVLQLPPVPAELKSISPFLQRSDELAAKDPVMAYWCAYHAAQLGIALKPKEHPSREFLFALLGVLEQTKKDAGPNDAIDDESASSAYIENFALKVFAIADNEDRRGNATRGTAKKFLAAANFLELLSIFDKDKADSAESSNDEKIRYAKWKAADIAKAFREGRKPTPGPAGSGQPETDVTPELPSSVSESTPPPPAITRATAPPPHISDLPSPQQDGFFPQAPLLGNITQLSQLTSHGSAESPSPGGWSTVATPGTPGRFLGTDGDARRAHVRFSRSLSAEAPSPRVNGEQDPFAACAATSSVPPQSPYAPHPGPSAPPDPGFPSTSIAPERGTPPLDPFPAGFIPSPPISQHMPVSPPVQYALPPEAAVVAAPPVELNPVLIGRAQKHCKFAISALDYEDVEQAKKELREALKMLGG
ncbi:Vta1 like-domain-containing protein [Sparassis latifolia]